MRILMEQNCANNTPTAACFLQMIIRVMIPPVFGHLVELWRANIPSFDSNPELRNVLMMATDHSLSEHAV